MIFVAAFLFLLLGPVQGKIYDRCELARELKFVHEAPDHQLATWVCIAEHESQYNTSIVGHLSGDGSGDHGIFQISDQFWCSPPGKGYACGLSCAQLEDDDISDDFLCAQRIYKEHKHITGDGFNAWAVYKPHCKGPKVERYLKDCFNDSEGPKTFTTPTPIAAHGFFGTAAGRANKGLLTSTQQPFLNFRSPSVIQNKQFESTNSPVNSIFGPKSSPFVSNSFFTSTETPIADAFFTPTTTFRPSAFTSSTKSVFFNPTTTTFTTRRPTVFGFSTPSTTTLFTPTVSTTVNPTSRMVSYPRPIFIINGAKWY